MVTVRKVYPSMFDEIYPVLREFDLAELPKETWKSMFTNNWGNAESHCGYALFSNEKVVGFLGFVFSQRIVLNKLEKFCNLIFGFCSSISANNCHICCSTSPNASLQAGCFSHCSNCNLSALTKFSS